MNFKLSSLFIVLTIPALSFAYKYGEHKYIGDAAFRKFYLSLKSNGLFSSILPVKFNSKTNDIYFPDLSNYDINITYGALNALSGDHSANVLELERLLKTQNSYLLKVIALHGQYIRNGNRAAPDKLLLAADKRYLILAATNFSHFYDYGESIYKHLSMIDVENIRNLINPELTSKIFKKLNTTNAINMYATLHSTAIYLAELSGIGARNGNNAEAKQYLYYAFLYNAYADHFLQDAFSSGHLLVKRSLFSNLTNNKALHDFYCKYGTETLNYKGQLWKAYGDGYLIYNSNEGKGDSSLLKKTDADQSEETKRIIEATELSITEVALAFQKASLSDDDPIFSFLKIPRDEDNKVRYFYTHFESLQLIPFPYQGKLKNILPDSVLTKEMLICNQKPFYRNFIRSRIANSLVIGLPNGGLLPGKYFKGYELRINTASFNNHYSLNKKGLKKGTLDHWYNYTISYSIGNVINGKTNQSEKTWIIKSGLRANYDWWVGNKRFIGAFAYLEAGVMRFRDNTKCVLTPQIGLQLGSLFRFNYYNMPPLLRIPLQIMLPMKIHFGGLVSASTKTVYYSNVELDIAF